jgi:hypothetical protein
VRPIAARRRSLTRCGGFACTGPNLLRVQRDWRRVVGVAQGVVGIPHGSLVVGSHAVGIAHWNWCGARLGLKQIVSGEK